MLEIKVHEIRGECPVYKVGDKMVIDGPKIVLEETDAVCVHALSTLLHYVVALDEGRALTRKLSLSPPKSRRRIPPRPKKIWGLS